MKYWLYSFLLTILVLTQAITAQDINSNNNPETIDHAIYLEVGGSAIAYSINYEGRIGENLWGRVGASYFPGPFVEMVSFPLGMSYLIGKDVKHFELGFAVSPTYSESDFFTDESNKKEYGIIASPIIGYRFQPKEELFFRLAFTPFFTTFDTKFFLSGGLSFGYSF